MPEVRLVGEDGKQIGVIKTQDALAYAQQRDLDLVEVAPEARPPVCRVLDYSKYKYEQAQKLKAARKHQQQITIREIKFRPKIAQNDYDTKKGHVQRFLMSKDKVKVTIMFRGREVTHPERGVALLDKLAEELAEIGVVEQSPIQDGRNMTMMLAPSKAVLASEDEHDEHAEGGKRLRREQRLALEHDAEEGETAQAQNGSAPKAKSSQDKASSEAPSGDSDEAPSGNSDEAPSGNSDEAPSGNSAQKAAEDSEQSAEDSEQSAEPAPAARD